MSFRISAFMPDGERVETTRLEPVNALIVAERWKDQGRRDVAILDRAGQSLGIEDFRLKRSLVKARFRLT